MLTAAYHTAASQTASEVSGTVAAAGASDLLAGLIDRVPGDLTAAYGGMPDLLDRLDDGFTDSVQSAAWEAGQAGKVDTYRSNDIDNVRLAASPGCCDFCAGYDGRILPPDSDGVPPLHRGCTCDLETLPPPEPQES
ncbi:MAG TPA: hypothetical protein VMT43_11610 [Acidimicrobiales bacterium]|nr:hypothetical protein [Acidimicrobiales bacterium]